MKREITLDELVRRDPRYSREAYRFVSDALEHTVSKLSERRHVTGQELSQGIKDYALREFGPLAREVFRSWGVRSTADFGEIVYNLIEIGVMGKTDEDRREDFHNVYDLNAAFEEGFNIRISEDQLDL
jgi:uncharacterized repeat protein (TIGR04138 family)